MGKTYLVGGFLLTIILSLSSSFAQTTQPQTQIDADAPTPSEPPTPPRTPPPNKTRPGGGLSPVRHSCDRLDSGLRALVPVENPVLTTSTHPTFLFYVPYAASEIQYGQFSILTWPDETQRLGKINFTLPEAPGIVSVTLPNAPEFALQEDRYYHWYFQLFCPGNKSLEADFEVNGWVFRMPPRQAKSALQDSPLSTEIWYDTLAELALQLQASPQDEALRATWNALMQRIGAEDALDADFVGTVIPQN